MAKNTEQENTNFAIPKRNYRFILIGFVILVIGFLLMIGGGNDDPNTFFPDEIFSFRRVTLAPVIVLAGFVFEIWAIMHLPKTKK